MEIATPFATPIPGVSNPPGSGGTDWNTILTVIGIVLSLVALWAGFERIHFSSPVKAILSLLNVVLIIASIVGLGWPGAFLAGGVSLLAILGHSTWLAI